MLPACPLTHPPRQGATVFLDSPKFDGDAARIVPAAELAPAPAAPSLD